MLMTLAAGAAAIAAVTLVLLLSLARKFSAVSRSHWELRYEFARLRARVAKLDGGSAGSPDPEDPTAGAAG